ncbi:hypothetical protein FB45DRAFT_1052721 [Roridomyces roridus]|uniref:Uncharacterized protein n=1 Tax=Roridomyces roridus TaxID=1738132 RepID=A0AAD7CCM7_9AGAR|nr:hypothetical protein FB45DRAFT_1052721 [Roridomyces roridus]
MSHLPLSPLPSSTCFFAFKMLSPLTFSPSGTAARWSGSTIPPSTSISDLPFELPDRGQIQRVHYPIPVRDRRGYYHSPRTAFLNQVAANRRDHRWKDAGLGLGIGLAGVTTRFGVVQSNYILSQDPLFLDTLGPVNEPPTKLSDLSRKVEAEPEAEYDSDTEQGCLACLWTAVAGFLGASSSASTSRAAAQHRPATPHPAHDMIELVEIELTPPVHAHGNSASRLESPTPASPPRELPHSCSPVRRPPLRYCTPRSMLEESDITDSA